MHRSHLRARGNQVGEGLCLCLWHALDDLMRLQWHAGVARTWLAAPYWANMSGQRHYGMEYRYRSSISAVTHCPMF